MMFIFLSFLSVFGELIVSEKCESPTEFSAGRYRPTLDGIYSFHLLTEPQDLSKLSYILIEVDGSFIPFLGVDSDS